MFEIIGLFIGTAIVFAFAACVGLVYALCAWLILPKGFGKSIRIGIAFSIPIVSVAYMWFCVAFLPGQTLFGDINQPLPNGYRLEALGKMPEYGNIKRDDDAFFKGVQGSVDQIAVSGPIVAARYCQTCDPAFVQSKSTYVALDTRNGQSSEYKELGALQANLPSKVALLENQFFRSQEPRYVSQQRIERSIMFIPPILCTVFYFAFAIRQRIRANPSPSTRVYT